MVNSGVRSSFISSNLLIWLNVLSCAGGDDRRVLVWKVQEALSGIDHPKAMKGQHNSNIFCLSFDHSNTKIFSGGKIRYIPVAAYVCKIALSLSYKGKVHILNIDCYFRG